MSDSSATSCFRGFICKRGVDHPFLENPLWPFVDSKGSVFKGLLSGGLPELLVSIKDHLHHR